MAADLLIVGAGPAGMAAAVEARRHGLSVVVADDQPGPGGQIWRAVEARTAAGDARRFGSAYVRGAAQVANFRRCGATYLPETEVWQLDGTCALVKGPQGGRAIPARTLLLTAGAQERPFAFPGWTLPGVMTVGAAQILLKSSRQIPHGRVWIAGRGPLPLLYAQQFLTAGGRLAGYLDMEAPGLLRRGASRLPGALSGWRDLAKGAVWMARLGIGGGPGRTPAADLAAIGQERLRQITWTGPTGDRHSAGADVLLVHDSLIPSGHIAASLGCRMRWSPQQDCETLDLDRFNETSVANVFGAGDCCRIGGVELAEIGGRIAALGVLRKLGRLSEAEADDRARRWRREAARHGRFRAFLDAVYPPRRSPPAEGTLVCRCEDLAASEIRRVAAQSRGLNQVKAATRICMGPCQGRQCAETLRTIMAEATHRSPESLGGLAARPPYRPITLGEIASMEYQPPAIERM